VPKIQQNVALSGRLKESSLGRQKPDRSIFDHILEPRKEKPRQLPAGVVLSNQ
jgi:hypothetical protein